ncbi:MAG: aminotransferase class IV [Myxococcota bacterium]
MRRSRTGNTARKGSYTTARVTNGRVERVERHARRLFRDAARLELPLPNLREIEELLIETAACHFRESDGIIRVEWSRRGEAPPELVATTREIGAAQIAWRAERSQAIHPGLADRRNTKSVAVDAYDTARSEITQGENDESLLFDADGFLVEGGRSNLLIVMPTGGLLAPDPALGAVEGLGLTIVLESVAEVETIRITQDELQSAEELMAVNAVRGVMPIIAFDGRSVGSGAPGRWSKRLQPLFHSLVLSCGFGLALLGIACTPDVSELESTDSIVSSSVLAVGDTGRPLGILPGLFEGQFAVGAAMQREHARLPVDAFVLLGDNFYPAGLLAEELRPRIIENIVRPYCAFVEISEELAGEIDGHCEWSEEPRPRFFAILGNHDVIDPGSPLRQQTEVPGLILNWEMPVVEGPAIRELPNGLSLIFLNSDDPWGEPKMERLADALRRARGPWRIIVGHRPPIAGHPQLSQMVARASKESGKIVHAYLAGHVHVLAAIRAALPAPALTVIAGSGSSAHRQDTTEYRIEDADLITEELGFVRLDVLAESEPKRLRVTLFRAPPSAALAFMGNKTIARYEIHLNGAVTRRD